MKIKILEYHRYKAGIIRVQSHNRKCGKWKKNKNFEMHKMLVEQPPLACPIIYKKEYVKDIKENEI